MVLSGEARGMFTLISAWQEQVCWATWCFQALTLSPFLCLQVVCSSLTQHSLFWGEASNTWLLWHDASLVFTGRQTAGYRVRQKVSQHVLRRTDDWCRTLCHILVGHIYEAILQTTVQTACLSVCAADITHSPMGALLCCRLFSTLYLFGLVNRLPNDAISNAGHVLFWVVCSV
jgi:hypothetical protein